MIREVKVVLLGDTGVGKTSMVLRFVTDSFKPYNESTIGASFLSKMILINGKQVKYQIWDTAGQEKYHSLAPMYYRGAAVAIIVYDITRAASFKVLRTWIEELRNRGPKDIVIILAGNKADLDHEREVPRADAENFATQLGAMYFETSAKEDINIQDMFVQMYAKLPPPPPTDYELVRPGSKAPPAKSTGTCC